MFLINGQRSETLSVQDRGLHYGDGVFETLAVQQRQPMCWDQHYQRLHTGCQRLGMECPASGQLLEQAVQLINNSGKAVLKIILTRGAGGRGYRPPEPPQPLTSILGLYPWPEYPEQYRAQGVIARYCRTRLGQNPALAGIKHLNRLEQVLARSEWKDPQIAEGLMLNTADHVIAGTMSNVFIINGNELVTPDVRACGIAGVVRQQILDLAQACGLRPWVSSINPSGLTSADEIFLCNSLIGIWPVLEIGGHTLKSGPYAQKLRQMLIQQKIIVE